MFGSVQRSLLAWSCCSRSLVSARLATISSVAADSNVAGSTLVSGFSRKAGSGALSLDILQQLLQVQRVPGWRLNADGSKRWGRFLVGQLESVQLAPRLLRDPHLHPGRVQLVLSWLADSSLQLVSAITSRV